MKNFGGNISYNKKI